MFYLQKQLAASSIEGLIALSSRTAALRTRCRGMISQKKTHHLKLGQVVEKDNCKRFLVPGIPKADT